MKIGAEADIINTKFNNKKYIIKKRIQKKYRVAELDEKIRKCRTKKEAKILQLCFQKKIPVPVVFVKDKYSLLIEFIKGITLKEFLEKSKEITKIKYILKKCGFFIAQMHKTNIVHGDLTSTNIIVKKEGKELIPYFIDFGFGQITLKIELKAMDIYLFEKIFIADFPDLKKHLQIFEEEYFENLPDVEAKQIKKRLLKIQKRGRYKD
ncbi:MAG: Kae1-associated kinase Bud32 [Candidatus Aenigmarchaeota archaeon ex4484_52]|nr:MAG: Kae1-associated kinase Bud32 [Candidatus Aenigmarchaeota archaeon ex4484_52]